MARGKIKTDQIEANAESDIIIASPIMVDQIAVNVSTSGVAVESPLKFGTMTLLSPVVSGTLEFDGYCHYGTAGTVRFPITFAPKRIIPGELTLSYNSATLLNIARGSVLDSTYTYPLNLTSAWTKSLASSWVAGTGNNGLDVSSPSINTTYHVFLIRKDSDASIDILFSASATSPAMPTGYTYKRRIGCIRTDGVHDILKFYQHGNRFMFDVQFDSRAMAALAGTNRISVTTVVPENCIGIFSITLVNTAAASAYYFIAQAVEETDSAASSTHYSAAVYTQNDYNSFVAQIAVDSSRNIAIRGTSTNISCRIGVDGWIDTGI